MTKNCIVPLCHHRGKILGIKYHRITASRKNSWLQALGRNPNENICRDSFVCSDHFKKEQIKKDGSLSTDAIPTINLKPTFRNKQELRVDTAASSSRRQILKEISIPNTANILSQETAVEAEDNITEEVAIETVVEEIPPRVCRTYTYEEPSSVSASRKRNVESPFISSSSDSIGLTEMEKKKRRITREEHSYNMSPRKLKCTLESTSEKNQVVRKRLYATKRRLNRLQNKILSLKDIVHTMKTNNVLSSNAASVLEKTFSGIPLEIMKRLMRNLQKGTVTRQQFPEELKCFALTLQFYSCKAYDYVRDVFKLALPSPSILRTWVNNVQCKPGFCTTAFELLHQTCSNMVSEGKILLCSMVLDEIAIKKQIDFVGQNTWGYVDMGTGLNDDTLDCATEALVLNGYSSAEKATIVREALTRLHIIGVKIVSLTFDGPSANFNMATELGAEVNDICNLKTHFEHPEDNSNVYVIFDACHMLKLLRNNWAVCGKFIDMWGNVVDFEYITKLYNLQEREMLRLANKLKKAHIDWQRQKMKVNIAAQTISRRVADALQFLKDELKHPEFIDAEGTIKFLRLMDSTFDLLNSRNIFGKGSKAPLKKLNENFWSPILTEAVEYLLHIKNMDGKYMIHTKNKTPFRGFIITIKSLLGLYKDYVKPENGLLKYLLTYKFSQDHIELFFCQIRSRNGWNNNPTAFQFYCTFKRLLLKNCVKNLKGNCIIRDVTHLLEFKSSNNLSKDNITIDDISLTKKYNINITEEVNDHDYCVPQNPKLNIISENVVAYMSGFVVRLIKKEIKCDTCTLSLEKYQGTIDDSLMLYKTKTTGGLIRPSRDVISILIKVEIAIRKILNITDNKLPREDDFINTLTNILGNQMLAEGKLFSTLQNHFTETTLNDESHISRLVKKIIFVYLKIRFHAIAKKYTEQVRGELIRKKLSKIILFSHQ